MEVWNIVTLTFKLFMNKNVTYVKIDKTNLELITDGKYFII